MKYVNVALTLIAIFIAAGFIFIGIIASHQKVDSIAISILEVYLVILSIIVAALAFVGYNVIKEESKRIAQETAEKLVSKYTKELKKSLNKSNSIIAEMNAKYKNPDNKDLGIK